MLNSKILILRNELREMSIQINLCLKFQKISQIKKNRENKYLSIMNILEKVLKYHTNSQSQILKEI